MFNAISQTITDFDNGVSVFHFIGKDLSSAALPSPVVFIKEFSMMYIRVLHFLLQYLKVSLRLRLPLGLTVDLSVAAEANS